MKNRYKKSLINNNIQRIKNFFKNNYYTSDLTIFICKFLYCTLKRFCVLKVGNDTHYGITTMY